MQSVFEGVRISKAVSYRFPGRCSLAFCRDVLNLMIVQSVVSDFTFENNKSQIHFTLCFSAIFSGTSKMVGKIYQILPRWPEDDVISDLALENYPDASWIRRMYPQDFAVRLLCDRLQMDGVAIGPGAWMTPMVRDLL